MDRLPAGARELGLDLSPSQLRQFEIYYRELVEWNRRVNLTAITGYEDVQVKHFLDALTITRVWRPPLNDTHRLIDVGSGAGIPGIPLKIIFPQIKLALLDSTAKKTAFLGHIKQKLGMEDVEIVLGRAEETGHCQEYREKFDIVVSRAVARLPVLAEFALPFCTMGGIFVAQKKGDIRAEVDGAGQAISELGGRLREVKRIDLEALSDERWLVVIDKVSATPPKYPRRPGIPAKRPIR